MSRTADVADDVAGGRSSDVVFGIAAGLYLALLVTPVVVRVASAHLASDPGVQYLAVLGVGVAVVVSMGVLFDRRPAYPVRFGASRATWLPALASLAVVVGSVASLDAGGGSPVLGLFLGGFATVAGLLLGVLARSRYARAATMRAAESPTWTAGWPAADERRVHLVAAVVAALSAVAFVAGSALGRDDLRLVGQFVLTLGLVTPTLATERRYAATPAGLVVRYPVVRRLLSWSAFDGYSRTSDAIVVHRPRRLDLRIATADLEDPDAVADALGRRLPERA